MPLEAEDPLVVEDPLEAEDSRVLVKFLGVENILYRYLFIFFFVFHFSLNCIF